MTRICAAAAVAVLAAAAPPARAAEPVVMQCGREYQAAKAAGTLNGADWNAYRQPCAARPKGSATAAPAPSPTATGGSAPSIAPTAPTAGVAVPAASPPAASGGLAAMHARQRQCGAEWRAGKVALVAATPGLTWPKYWSQCNARLKTAKD